MSKDLAKQARKAIKRSGFKTRDDFYATLGGDIKAMQDPLVQEMLAQLPDQACTVCGKPIRIQIMKNTGFCSGRCVKAAAKA